MRKILIKGVDISNEIIKDLESLTEEELKYKKNLHMKCTP